MARCGCCGKVGLRKTTMASVIERGRVVGKRVGECCAGDGVLIVASKVAPVVEDRSRKDQREHLAPFIKNLQARLDGRRSFKAMGPEDEPEGGAAHYQGYNEAIEDVIALLREGRA